MSIKGKGENKKKKKEKIGEEEEVSESLATILREELGEDDDTLSLIKQLEDPQRFDAIDEKKEKNALTKDQTQYRRCTECGLDTLFINGVCSECGHKFARTKKNSKIETLDSYGNIPEDDE